MLRTRVRINCSVMMLRKGAHAELWSDFSLDKLDRIPRYEFPDDQGWLWYRAPKARGLEGWRSQRHLCVQETGLADTEMHLPTDARIVSFIGWRDPNTFTRLPWVQEHWLRK